MNRPFQDKIFIDLMESILKTSKYKRNVICNALAEAKTDANMVPYYTLDCALCYLTYKEIKERDKPNTRIMEKLEERVIENLEKIKE
jgi:hypothetical protein